MSVSYKPFKRVFLFGGTPLIIRLAVALKKSFSVTVFTAPRQRYELGPETCGVQIKVVDDINAVNIGQVVNAIGIGLGEAWSFGPAIRKAFGNCLIDFMGIPYPSYLGGAHMTHAMLRDEKFWGCCMQLVTKNTVQGKVHDGDVIYGQQMRFEKDMEARYVEFICDFVEKANAGHTFSTKDHGMPSYQPMLLPRLNTVKQGWIDWSWSGQDIVRFINAFDEPYPGARTMCGDYEITLHQSEFIGGDKFHPFHAGLIVSQLRPGNYHIATKSGTILCKMREPQLRAGMRLFTSREQLETAMLYEPNYSARGDANA